MPINISTIPKKKAAATATKAKKQDDATRVYKSSSNNPPNAPHPPSSPESDATDNEHENEVVATATATDAAAVGGVAVEEPKSKTSPTKKGKGGKDSYDRLEVNRLLSDLFPSKYMEEKVKQLEVSSKRKSTRKSAAAATAQADINAQADITAQADPIAQAIIDTAFSATSTSMSPIESNGANAFITPPATPWKEPTAPNAPKKANASSAAVSSAASAAVSKRNEKKEKPEKQKQNFNIIIHVEPKAKSNEPQTDISKRLDFGSAKKKSIIPVDEEVNDEDDSDEDYVPGDSEDESYDDDDEYFDDEDDEYDDDSYYSSSSDSDEEEFNAAEMEAKQQKFIEEMKMLQSLRATYEEMLEKDKTNRIVANQLKTLQQSEDKIRQEIDDLTHKQKRSNSKKFRKLLRKKNSTNDLEYFKKNLTIQQQRALIDELNEVAKVTAIEKPYKLTLLESDIPRDMKAVAIRKVGMLHYMEPGCGEYCKLKNWVDAFMQIPFGKNKNLPLTIADGVDRCHDFMTAAKTRLDAAVYGLNDAKMQIMQMVGQWIANPAAIGTAVAIHGPPGTGKTSLVKEGISKILGRDFAFIALGGATDSSFLEGHSYTYEGSMWGKIVDILIRCKSSNPVIYFDELDKISETSKGEEIVGILTHLTDTSQNSQFHDKYFSEVAFDLSKCLFIFSYNDESRVNPVLLDRMYKIRTTGYGTKDKTFIAQNHLIPRIRSEVAFAEGDIVIPDSVIEYLVENHTHKEAGVRNLKRCLEIIYTKLNLYRLMRPGTQLFEDKEQLLEVSFPYTVNREVVDKLIKKGDTDRPNINMYL
jgi:ATP-dependent Lon protease